MLDLKRLNDQQRQAVKSTPGALLVVAGAGTGKTQVISYRLAYLIDQLKVKPSEILAVTFTDKAAREMETRLTELLARYILDVKITTFNSFGHDLLRRFAYELGLSQDLQLLTDTQQVVFLREQIDNLRLNYYAPITNPEGFLYELTGYFSKLAAELVPAAKYTKFVQNLTKQAKTKPEKEEAARQRELAYAYKRYNELKRQANLIDFDDQVTLVVELLERFTNVRAKVQAECRYILVDEFQDTNSAQSRLVDLLVGNDQNIMVVGDDDQSVYRFRGAAVANILSFADRYPKANRLALTKNYRSSQPILDAAYRLVQYNNPERLESKYSIDKRLIGQFSGPKPILKTFLTLDEEAAWVATDIKQRLKKGQLAAEIAVLLRKNAQASTLTAQLEARAIDYLVIGQKEDLYRQPVVRLLLNFLRVVTDPHDSTSLYHLLAVEPYKLDGSYLRDQAALAKRSHEPLEVVLKTTFEAKDQKQAETIDQFLAKLAEWRDLLPSLSVGQLCLRFLDDTGYLHKLIARARREPALDQTINYLNQFFGGLGQFGRIATDDSAIGYLSALPALLGGGQNLVIEDLPELFGQKVRLLTIHKAKGLEFECVYLFDMTQDTFPARRQASSLEPPAELLSQPIQAEAQTHLAEERRLMYVAMTRAKRNLILTYSSDHGGRQAKRPSIFIEEALGEQAQLAKLKPKLVNTDQIELFRTPKPDKKAISNLPPSLFNGIKLALSARQIEDYLMCPAEFYLRHILSPPQPLDFALEYGNLIHSAIQLFNRRLIDGHRPKLEDLLTYLKSNWPKESFISQGHNRRSLAQAKKTLTAFYERERKAKRPPRYIEQPFEIELADLDTIVRGRFDAVYEAESVEVRDYKTGAASITGQAKADQKAKDSLQLGIYALAWQNLKHKIPDILSLDFVDSGYIGRASKTARQLATVERKIKQVADGLRAGDFKPKGSHIFCTHQEYGF